MAVHQVTFTDYTVNDITDPAEIKAYLESQGQEYNENITAIHQITFIDGEATPEGFPFAKLKMNCPKIEAIHHRFSCHLGQFCNICPLPYTQQI